MPCNEIERGQLCSTTIQCFTGVRGDLKSLPGLIKKVIRERAWEKRVDHGFMIDLGSLRELVTEKPIRGWGQDPSAIEALIKHDPEALCMWRGEMTGEGGRPKETGDNITSLDGRKTGTSRAYSIDRVRREAPQFADDVLAGRMSPNAALVKAGLRDNRQLYIPKDPAEAAKKVHATFGDEFFDQFADAVLQLRSALE